MLAKLRIWRVARVGAFAFVVAACDDPFDSVGGGSGGTATGPAGGAGGQTSTTGTGTGTATPGGTTTGTDSGVETGTPTGAGPACTALGTQDECEPGQKCTVVDPASGTLGCLPAGAAPDFAVCTSNQQCGVASWCDEPTGVCRPICPDVALCTGTYGLAVGTVCAPTQHGGQTVLGGLKLCSAHCHPATGVPCRQDAGPVTCAFDDLLADWDCMSSGGVEVDGDCAETRDCAAGLACGLDAVCRPWCTDVNACCSSCKIYCFCQACNAMAAELSFDGTPYGSCGAAESRWCCE